MPAATGELYLNGPQGGLLIFTSPDKVFEMSNSSEQKEAVENADKTPKYAEKVAPKSTDEWISWFKRRKKLEAKKLDPFKVGQLRGEQIVVASDVTDVMYDSKPENHPLDLCGDGTCVPLFPFPESSVYSGIVSFAEDTPSIKVGSS